MTPFLSMARMTPHDAMTLTKAVQNAVRVLVEELGPEAVGEAITTATAMLGDTIAPLVGRRPAPVGQRQAVDRAADRLLAAVRRMAELYLHAFAKPVVPLDDAEITLTERAERILKALFPNGTGFLHGRWSLQYGATEDLLARAADPAVHEDLEALHLTPFVSYLARVHEVYGLRMGYAHPLPEGQADELDRWYVALERYLGAVVTIHLPDSAVRARLLAPYESIVERIRAARRRAEEATAAPEPETAPDAP